MTIAEISAGLIRLSMPRPGEVAEEVARHGWVIDASDAADVVASLKLTDRSAAAVRVRSILSMGLRLRISV